MSKPMTAAKARAIQLAAPLLYEFALMSRDHVLPAIMEIVARNPEATANIKFIQQLIWRITSDVEAAGRNDNEGGAA